MGKKRRRRRITIADLVVVDSITNTEDSINAVKSKERTLNDCFKRVKGSVTVIKNKGKKNEEILAENKDNYFTIAARDKVLFDMYEEDIRTGAGFIYMALSSDATAISEDSTDDTLSDETALDGEITTVSTGLTRVQTGTGTTSTIDHTAGSNTVEISHQFEALSEVNNVQKAALFNHGTKDHSTEVMGNILTFSATNMDNGDTLTLTWTITLG